VLRARFYPPTDGREVRFTGIKGMEGMGWIGF